MVLCLRWQQRLRSRRHRRWVSTLGVLSVLLQLLLLQCSGFSRQVVSRVNNNNQPTHSNTSGWLLPCHSCYRSAHQHQRLHVVPLCQIQPPFSCIWFSPFQCHQQLHDDVQDLRSSSAPVSRSRIRCEYHYQRPNLRLVLGSYSCYCRSRKFKHTPLDRPHRLLRRVLGSKECYDSVISFADFEENRFSKFSFPKTTTTIASSGWREPAQSSHTATHNI